MRTERFDHSVVAVQGRPMRAFLAKCGGCSYETKVHVNTQSFGGSGHDEKDARTVMRKLEKLGWRIGARKTQDRCPECLAEEGRLAMNGKKVEAPVAAFPNAVSGTSIEPPREMKREDRRIIFEKLNEVYRDEKIGYEGNWTDAKVATDLGVPRAWVSSVREEMFGEAAGNDEITSFLSEAKGLRDEAITMMKQISERAALVERKFHIIEGLLRGGK